MCKSYEQAPKLHLFTDGRDDDPKSALKIFEDLQRHLDEYGGEIYTICGRYAMDRDSKVERTELAWDAIVNNKGESAKDYNQSINNSRNIIHEFIL